MLCSETLKVTEGQKINITNANHRRNDWRAVTTCIAWCVGRTLGMLSDITCYCQSRIPASLSCNQNIQSFIMPVDHGELVSSLTFICS